MLVGRVFVVVVVYACTSRDDASTFSFPSPPPFGANNARGEKKGLAHTSKKEGREAENLKVGPERKVRLSPPSALFLLLCNWWCFLPRSLSLPLPLSLFPGRPDSFSSRLPSHLFFSARFLAPNSVWKDARDRTLKGGEMKEGGGNSLLACWHNKKRKVAGCAFHSFPKCLS